jgi:aerobic carbon-monoxide dehydrogenase large subunit
MEERVTLSVQADGMIEVFSAVMPMGQGIGTTLAQLVVDAFGVPLDAGARGHGRHRPRRRLWLGRLALAVHRRLGHENWRSDRTIAQGKTLAAKEFEAAEADIVYAAGRFQRGKGTDMSMGLFELASKPARAAHAHGLDQRKVDGPPGPAAAMCAKSSSTRTPANVQVVSTPP